MKQEIDFRILSYNIHKGIGGLDRKYKPERIIDTIYHYQPDIVLLQEVDDDVRRSRNHIQVDLFASALGYQYKVFQANVFLRNGCYGNAILSKFPITNHLDIDLTVPPKKRRRGLAIQVEITNDKHFRPVVLVNVHLGLAAYERAIQLRKLTEHPYLSSLPLSQPVLLGGDFNDLWGNLCKKVLNDQGYASTLGMAKTYPAVYPSRALDRIFHRGRIKVLNAFVGRTKLARAASDHLPIIADFSLMK